MIDLVALAEAVATAHAEEEVRHAAVRCVVDWAGCALAGSAHPAVDVVARSLDVLGADDRCTLVGRSGRASPFAAALANGTASHVLDFDDVNVTMIGHPAVVVVPAALAVAEATGAGGEALCAGVAAGYEVAAELGAEVNPAHYERGWHATATLGCAAAAAAACRVAGADPPTTARAVSAATTQAGGVRAVFGSHGKAFHAGRAAATGVLASRLAEAEPPPAGPPDDVGRLAHGLRTAGQADIGLAEQDLLGALHDRLEARPAQPVHGQGGPVLRYPRAQGDVPGEMDGVRRGLQSVAEEGVIHPVRRDSRRLHGRHAAHHAEVGRGEVLQRAPERAESRALAREKHDIPVLPLCSHRSQTTSAAGFSFRYCRNACLLLDFR